MTFEKGNVPWNKDLKGLHLSPMPPPHYVGRLNPKWVEPIERICENCAISFFRKPWQLRKKRGGHTARFCSTACRNEWYVKTNHLGKIRRRITPSSSELRFIELCTRYDFPFRFTGDGAKWIGRVNPDFIWEDKKVAVEIMSRYYHDFYRNFAYGKLLPWFKTPFGRREYLNSFGWRCIVFWDNFTEKEALKELLKICPLQKNLLRVA